MDVHYHSNTGEVDWETLRQTLIKDDFHNGRTTRQLRQSFENSQLVVYATADNRAIGTARALSDGVCNCYVVDVWTRSDFRKQGIATQMMNQLIDRAAGQHIYLQSDDTVPFYERLGFQPQPEGLFLVSGEWLNNRSN